MLHGNHGSVWTQIDEMSNFIISRILPVPMKLIDLCEITEIDNLCNKVTGIKISKVHSIFGHLLNQVFMIYLK